MKLLVYSEELNVLYINTKAITPDTSNMSFIDRCEALDEAFSMTYGERIKRYASAQHQRLIGAVLKEHKGCAISEFTGI